MSVRPHEVQAQKGRSFTLLIVAIAAVVAHTISLCAMQLWVYPDSIDYIELAGGIVTRGDWSNELFLIRPPGYPIFLAIVFKLFGDASPTAIQVLQHLMGVAIAMVTALLALRVTGRTAVGILAGICCATSLQILAYCNMPLTEIPATLALVGGIYCLVAYWQTGSWRMLVACSACAGAAYLIKPVAVFFFGIVGCVVLVRTWCSIRAECLASPGRKRDSLTATLRKSIPRLAAQMSVAALPAVLIAAPSWVHSAALLGGNGTTRCLDYVLYVRPIEMDRLDTPDTRSAALLEIRAVVAEASKKGLLGPDADYRDRLTVLNAYKRLRGIPFAESTKMLGRAGWDIILEHPRSFAVRTTKYAAWTVLAPDPVYRFVPGGAPSVDGQRDKSAEFFDISTYSVGAASWEDTLAKHSAYLPLSSSPRAATPIWHGLKRFFRANVGRGPSPIGLRDSLFEEFVLLCLAGGIASLFGRRKREAIILVAIVAAYLAITAFLSGPQTRYAVVVKPIMSVWLAIAVVGIADVVRHGAQYLSGQASARSLQEQPTASV